MSKGFDINCAKPWTFFFNFKCYEQSLILHVINKVQCCCSIFSIETSSSWFHPSGSTFDPLATFLLVFLAFSFLTFLPFVHKTFLILWNVKDGFCFASPFQCSLLIPQSEFCCVSDRLSFYPHYRHDQSHCVHLKVLQVGRFLLPLSLLKYFLFQT